MYIEGDTLLHEETNVDGNLYIKSNSSLTIDCLNVDGNIIVQDLARITVTKSLKVKNIKLHHGSTMTLRNARVMGRLEILEGSKLEASSNMDIEDLVIINNQGSLRVLGDLTVKDSIGVLDGASLFIGGSVTATSLRLINGASVCVSQNTNIRDIETQNASIMIHGNLKTFQLYSTNSHTNVKGHIDTKRVYVIGGKLNVDNNVKGSMNIGSKGKVMILGNFDCGDSLSVVNSKLAVKGDLVSCLRVDIECESNLLVSGSLSGEADVRLSRDSVMTVEKNVEVHTITQSYSRLTIGGSLVNKGHKVHGELEIDSDMTVSYLDLDGTANVRGNLKTDNLCSESGSFLDVSGNFNVRLLSCAGYINVLGNIVCEEELSSTGKIKALSITCKTLDTTGDILIRKDLLTDSFSGGYSSKTNVNGDTHTKEIELSWSSSLEVSGSLVTNTLINNGHILFGSSLSANSIELGYTSSIIGHGDACVSGNIHLETRALIGINGTLNIEGSVKTGYETRLIAKKYIFILGDLDTNYMSNIFSECDIQIRGCLCVRSNIGFQGNIKEPCTRLTGYAANTSANASTSEIQQTHTTINCRDLNVFRTTEIDERVYVKAMNVKIDIGKIKNENIIKAESPPLLKNLRVPDHSKTLNKLGINSPYKKRESVLG